MASFKFKPLSTQRIFMEIFDEEGELVSQRISKIGEYFDIEIPKGGHIEMSEHEEVVIEEPVVTEFPLGAEIPGDEDGEDA